MGAVKASKMPKAKTITRKDNPNEVKAFGAGGKAKVKKYSLGSLVDDMTGKGMLGVAPMEANKVPEKRKTPDEDKGNFVEWKDRTDKSQYGMKKGGWIQNAIKKPGALRKSLGVKQGEKIPAKKLAAAAKAPGKLGQRARLAQTLKKMK
jgi:hypothetical protein